eukprot:TRINITY_DN1_c0_g1_i1.p1 TRINITY_DN1_c0_g1~~TRINITY_DN1_c0_g1_i1.p1  ORF type:complete len:183 (-),score=78.10 TRINITY_DN1_c0_g1_i1:379-927(-)
MTFEVSEEYALVLFTVVIMAFQVIITSFGVGSRRKKYFTKEFFEKNFDNVDPSKHKLGYPDMGNGRFSSKLTLEQWADFNNAQRAHYNYIEQFASVAVFNLVGGLFFPNFCAALGLVYIIGRALYAIGYKASGPGGRLFGVLLVDLSFLCMFGAACYGLYGAVGGYERLMERGMGVVEMFRK